MSLAALLEMLSALLGLFSAAFFCIGVLHLKQSSVEAIAFSMWQKGITIATELVAQKNDFVAGTVLLFIAFALQFPLKVWPDYFSFVVVSTPLSGVLVSLSVSIFLAAMLRALSWARSKKAIRELQEKKAKQDIQATEAVSEHAL